MKTSASKTELQSVITRMEQRLCEYLITTPGADTGNSTNAFNRQVATHTDHTLKTMTGLAIAGLRTAAVMPAVTGTELYDVLKMAVSRHFPLVIYLWDDPNRTAELPGILLHPEAGDCITDFSLLSHELAEALLCPVTIVLDPAGGYAYKEDIPLSLFKEHPGNPDDRIGSVTAAQKMVFGKSRRRIPMPGNTDIPVMINDNRHDYYSSLSGAAMAMYQADIQSVINDRLNQLTSNIERDIKLITPYQCGSSQVLLLTTPAFAAQARAAVDLLQKEQQKCCAIVVKQIAPAPGTALRELVKEGTVVTLDAITTDGKEGSMFHTGAAVFSDTCIRIKEARCSRKTSAQDIVELVKTLKTLPSGPVFLGLNFTLEKSRLPKHEVLCQEIKRLFPDIDKRCICNDPGQATEATDTEVPFVIRNLSDKGPEYSKSSRFFHDNILPERNGGDELVADPFQAFPAIPPYSAMFKNQSGDQLPVFNATLCTACMACVANCPHSALPPAAMTVGQLIEAGMNIAKSKGAAFSKITPALKNLEKVSLNIIKNAATPPSSPEAILAPAFDKLADQIKPEGEKRTGMQEEFNAILDGVKTMPVALTDLMYHRREAREKGSGALFSLALNPDACTSCGLCVEFCEPGALVMGARDNKLLNESRWSFASWAHIPDANADLITSLVDDPSCHPFGALMLNKSAFISMSGASGSDAAEKSCVHMLCATADVAGMPGYTQIVAGIEDKLSRIFEQVQQMLNDALPGKKAATLEETIAGISAEKLPFDELIKQLGGHEQLKQVDVKVIRRKIELVHQLQDLKWALTEGPSGMGRARYSLVLAGLPAGSWGNDYPNNPFAVPVIYIDNDGLAVAEGWIQGQLRHALDNLRLLRRAELESSGKYDLDRSPRELAELSYNDLTDEEKAMIPPVLVIGRAEATNSISNGLEVLLDSELPVKLVLIDDAAPAPAEHPERRILSHAILGLEAAMRHQAHFLQGVMDKDTFVQLQEIMRSKAPAVCVLMTPDPRLVKDGTGVLNLSQLAKWTRAFPSIIYYPDKEKSFVRENLELEANPLHSDTWCRSEMEIGDDKTMDYSATWADWAFCMATWQDHFRPAEAEETVLPVAEYLVLEEEDRKGKSPCITRWTTDGLQTFVTDQQLIDVCEVVKSTWQFWQEMGGITTPFPDKLRKEVRAALQTEYNASLEAAKADFEKKLAEQATEQQDALRRKLRDKLVALSLKGMKKE